MMRTCGWRWASERGWMAKDDRREYEVVAIDEGDLAFNDAPRLIWVRVKHAVELLWRDNPKLHDIGSIATSVEKHGYQETAKFDANLFRVGQPDGAETALGAIKSGNGRLEALDWMERDGRYELPRGLGVVTETGAWAVWLLVGTDAASEAMAKAYAIDANNLVLSGGDFTPLDMMRLWDAGKYLEVIKGLADLAIDAPEIDLPVSVDGDDVDLLQDAVDAMFPLPPEDFPEYGDDIDVEYRCPRCGYEWSGSQT